MPSRTRVALGGLAMVAAPLLLLAGVALHPEETTDEARQLAIIAGARTRWYVAHLLLVAGFALMIPAVLALGRHLRQRAPMAELVGTALAVTGAVALIGLVALEGVGGWQLAQVPDRAGAVEALHGITHSAGVLVPFALLSLLLTIGLIVLAVAMGRSGVGPRWSAWVLGLAAVMIATGNAGAVHAVLLAGTGLLAVAFATYGLADLSAVPDLDSGRKGDLASSRTIRAGSGQ